MSPDRLNLKNKTLLLDGAMGTILQEKGISDPSVPPPILNITEPDAIRDIHRSYLKAGSDVVETNTFEANRFKLENTPYSVEETVAAGITRAREAGAERIALSIGPTGKLLEPLGELSFDEAYAAFTEIVEAGSGADYILFETFSDLNELRAAVLAAKEHSDLPVLTSMTFTEDGRTFTGTTPEAFTHTMQGLGVDALGVNCSLGPVELYPVVEKIAALSRVPVLVQANAGLPTIEDGKSVYSISPKEYREAVEKFLDLGVEILGGCCGTTPEYIAEISSTLPTERAERKVREETVLTTPTSTFDFSGFTVIGERINPTGRERIKKALREKNYDYIFQEALSQESEGADIIDVNLGLPEINEAEALGEVALTLPSLVESPLQLDSSKVDALEQALRVYPGIAIVNSVNAGEKSLETVLPLVAKYGAFVVGLTLDENGIPKTSEGRLKLAEKIVDTAKKYGIEKERVIIDALALTASAGVENATVCLESIEKIKKRLGVKTALGVSNVSFGLPNRELFNAIFLSYALKSGLDVAIINPASTPVMDAVSVYRVFEDASTDDYIRRFSDVSIEVTPETERDLKDCIIEGLVESTVQETSRLLENHTPAEIINDYFIPALDVTGKRYESGEIFLPQLMQSAKSVKAAFDLLKNENSAVAADKGKILIATVEGDIHDIGKNIVKMMFENYGYDVIDLGADVKIERIVERLQKEDIPLVGLSALMTTTVESMQKTIEAIRALGKDTRVLVGGAVLTPEYAEMIGADYYADDAQQSVRIANDFFETRKNG